MNDSTQVGESLPALFEHKKRKEWGLGVLAWERDDKRGYLFEDGQLRIVANGFYSLMQEVDRTQDEVAALYERLQMQLEATNGSPNSKIRASSAAPTLDFETQLAVFQAEYPGGFEDPEWVDKVRGAGTKKRLKRHREPAILEAQSKLSRNELDSRMSERQFRTVWLEVLAVLEHTDLVPAAQLKGLETEESPHHRALAGAVRELLYGEGNFEPRFDRFLSTFKEAFGKAADWQFATAVAALVRPDEHVCVRPNSFREQAKWMAPRLSSSKSVTAASYLRLLSMAKLTSEKLAERGSAPRDLMDVHDFIRLTTRPAARKSLTKLGENEAAPSSASVKQNDEAA